MDAGAAWPATLASLLLSERLYPFLNPSRSRTIRSFLHFTTMGNEVKLQPPFVNSTILFSLCPGAKTAILFDTIIKKEIMMIMIIILEKKERKKYTIM